MAEIRELNFQGRMEVAVRSILAPTAGGRSENQDNYLIVDTTGEAQYLHDQKVQHETITNWPTGHSRFAILDGMGGHSYGREATELTVQGLRGMPPTSNLGILSAYLDNLHLELHRQMHDNGAEPGCTLTLLEVPAKGPALLFHAGDSRLYRINAERAEYLTVDHVPATKFALFGLVEAEDWQRQAHGVSGFQISQAFILGNSLGTRDLFGEVLEESLFELNDKNLPSFLQGMGDRRAIRLTGDDTYLLASDGLWHLSNPLEFIDTWPTYFADRSKPLWVKLDDLFDELIQMTAKEARLRGDNSTAIAFRIIQP